MTRVLVALLIAGFAGACSLPDGAVQPRDLWPDFMGRTRGTEVPHGVPAVRDQGTAGRTITPDERSSIRASLMDLTPERNRVTGMRFKLGDFVPLSVGVFGVNTAIVSTLPHLKDCWYFIAGNELMITDRHRKVVAIIELGE